MILTILEGLKGLKVGLEGLEDEPVEAALEHGHETAEGKAHPQHLALIASRSWERESVMWSILVTIRKVIHLKCFMQ